MEPGLYVVGTPIGNLQDITLRALDTLRQADVILAEDTRVTQRLCARHEIRAPLVSCHRFNEEARTERVLAEIRAGRAVALVTDSGMPGVSDPGSRVVAAVRAAGHRATVIPGPSSVTAALALCGFGGHGFRFEGFLPHKSGARRRRLEELAGEDVPAVLFESPYRIPRLLDELAAALPDREVFVGRELTKLYEECLSGTPARLKAAFAGRPPRGEFVVVIRPAERRRAAANGEDGEGGGDG